MSTWLLLSPPSHQRWLIARALLHAVPLLSNRLANVRSHQDLWREGERRKREEGREGGREGGSQRLAGHQREAGRVIARMWANIAAQQSYHTVVVPCIIYTHVLVTFMTGHCSVYRCMRLHVHVYTQLYMVWY